MVLSQLKTQKPSYELMVKSFKKGNLPAFNDREHQLKKYQGLNIIYSNQCPWVARSIDELKEVAKKKRTQVKGNRAENYKRCATCTFNL